MKLAECLSSTFVALNFFSFLAKSDLAYTFLAMVRSPIPPTPPIAVHPIVTYAPSPYSLTFAYLPRNFFTDRPSSRDFLLPHHRPSRPNPPRGSRRNLAHIFPYPSLAGRHYRPSCRVVHASQSPTGCACERVDVLSYEEREIFAGTGYMTSCDSLMAFQTAKSCMFVCGLGRHVGAAGTVSASHPGGAVLVLPPPSYLVSGSGDALSSWVTIVGSVMNWAMCREREGRC